MISEKSKVPKRRKFVYDNENFYNKEEMKPCSAPKWTCAKYKGQLKEHVKNACNRHFGDELPSRPNELSSRPNEFTGENLMSPYNYLDDENLISYYD
jgi:hypothetical protein